MSAKSPHYEDLKITSYDSWTLYLHQAQNYLGRCYVALNRSGSLDPFVDTTPQEKTELEDIILQVQDALNDLYQPDLYNYANFRNTWPQCHWHIIPRYQTVRVLGEKVFVDKNWGKNYAPYDRDFKISSELLEEILNSIKRKIHD